MAAMVIDVPMQIIYKHQNVFHTFSAINDALEAVFVLEGLKPVARQMVHEEDAAKIVGFCKNTGLQWDFSGFKILKEEQLMVVPEYPEQGHYFMYLSKDKELAKLAKFYEATKNDEKLGELLGYPKCCVRFYQQNLQKAADVHNDYTLMSIANTGKTPSFTTNNMARFFSVSLISHFPCSYNCPWTERIGKANYDCVQKYNPGLAQYIRAVLRGPVISHANTGIHVLKGYSVRDGRIWYTNPWLTSQNEMHDTLQLCDNINVLGKNHVQLCQQDHIVEEIRGDHVGVVVFK